ncbi:MAG: amidohydrolase [Candidatus Cloacimonetes bacterium]|jgi:5-methylthioadenosine/S-adenosylhomocysteine deaminase|nr:amidohydrolase [Candidatus Cloacimonadota bacterium]
MNVDILLNNGLILEFNKKPEIKSITIKDGSILEVGKNLEKKYKATHIIDATDKIVMPGFVNTHSHVAMSYFKGLSDDLPLQEWLSEHIWPVEAKFLSAEFVKDAALHGCAEMIKNGITTFSDMYFFGDQTAESAEKAGIRAVLGEGVLDFPVANYQNADEIFAYIRKMHNKYEKNELIDFAVAPHAIYTCGKENLIKAKDLALELGILLHIHLSETKQEVQDCLKKNRLRPVEYLDSIGFFEGNVVVAHALWLDENEQNILAKNNSSIAINTSSNLKLASGFSSFKNYLDHGFNLSIGTDGVASNNNLSILQEISLLAKLQKALNDDPTILPAKEMIQIATIGGAKALKKSEQIGSIEVGKKADLILIDIDNIEAQPMYDPYSHLVYSSASEQIKDVIINGKIVMKDRELINIDAKELIEKAKYYQKILKLF